MRSPETITAAYFTYLALVAIFSGPLPNRRRFQIGLLSTVMVVGAVLVSRLPPMSVGQLVRDWVPGVFLLVGYWVPGLLYVAPNIRLERWLARGDARFSASLDAVALKAPRLVLEILELSYLSCYAVVPAIFAILYWQSGAGAAALSRSVVPAASESAEAGRFWTAVLLSEFTCYGLLPWLPSRPPRMLRGPATIDRRRLLVRRLNLAILQRFSVQVNTFPSGHVAGSLAAALIAWRDIPVIGAAAFVLALLIAAATIVGAYHYALDAVFGILVAVVVFALVS